MIKTANRRKATRRRDTEYKTLSATVKPDKLKALGRISKKFYANRSDAVERALDLLFELHKSEG